MMMMMMMMRIIIIIIIITEAEYINSLFTGRTYLRGIIENGKALDLQ
jgi:hypothetical protein